MFHMTAIKTILPYIDFRWGEWWRPPVSGVVAQKVRWTGTVMISLWLCCLFYGPLTRYVKLRVAHAPGMPGTFSPPPRFSDPDMHHGTCATHVPRCMPGSLTSGFLWGRWWGNVPGIPGTCTTRNFTYLVRGPQHYVCWYEENDNICKRQWYIQQYMHSSGELFVRSRDGYFGVYSTSYAATREINVKIILELVHKQFFARVHTPLWKSNRNFFFAQIFSNLFFVVCSSFHTQYIWGGRYQFYWFLLDFDHWLHLSDILKKATGSKLDVALVGFMQWATMALEHRGKDRYWCTVYL